MKDVTQLEALKDNVVIDNIKELNKSLDKIEEGNIITYTNWINEIVILLPASIFCYHFEYFLDDSTIADEELEDSDNSEDDNSIDEEGRLEDPEQDEDSPMEDEDKIEDPELNEDSIDDLSNMDRYSAPPPAPPGHKGAPPIPGQNIKVHAKKSEYLDQINF